MTIAVKLRYLLVVGCLIMGSAVTAHFQRQRQASSPPAQLIVDQTDLDFGSAWLQNDFQWVLDISNPSNEVVHIVDFGPSCGCTTVSPETLVLPAGAKRQVKLALDLTYQRSGRRKTATSAFQVELRPQFSSHIAPNIVWKVHGRVRKPLRLDPPSASFADNKLVAGESFPSKQVKIIPLMVLKDLRIQLEDQRATITAPDHMNSLSAGEEFVFHVHPRDDLPLGRFKFQGLIHGRTRNGERFSPVPFLIEGKVSPPVVCYPSGIRLAAREIGDAGTVEVELASLSSRSFRVTEIQASSPHIHVSRTNESVKNTFSVLWKCYQEGHQSDVITFQVTVDYGSRSVEHCVSLPVLIYGRSQEAREAT